MIYILWALIGLTSLHLNGMQQTHSSIIHRAGHNLQTATQAPNGGYVPKLTHAKDPQPSVCAVDLSTTLRNAVTQDDVKSIKNHFEHWTRWVNYWSNHNTEMTECLKLAATHSKEKTGKVVAYLLDADAMPTETADAACLLDAAAKNGHINIISHIHELYPKLGRWVLYTAIRNNQKTAVSNLLIGGIEANIGLGNEDRDFVILEKQDKATIVPGAHRPLHLAIYTAKSALIGTLLKHGACIDCKTATGLNALDIALKAFKKDDSAATISHRLYIVRTLLNHVPQDQIPSLNAAHMSEMSEETRGKIATLFTTHSAPTKAPAPVTMSEEPTQCTPEPNSDLTYGHVLVGACILCPLSTLMTIQLFCQPHHR